MARPHPSYCCEICRTGPNLAIIFDARVRESEYGAKGHWMWMCPVCHYLWGLGYDLENLTIYELHIDRYFEVRRKYYLTSDEIKEMTIKLRVPMSPVDKEYNIVTLLSELVYQQAVQTETLKIISENLVKLANPPQVSSEFKVDQDSLTKLTNSTDEEADIGREND